METTSTSKPTDNDPDDISEEDVEDSDEDHEKDVLRKAKVWLMPINKFIYQKGICIIYEFLCNL